jgi:hypothetical protein
MSIMSATRNLQLNISNCYYYHEVNLTQLNLIWLVGILWSEGDREGDQIGCRNFSWSITILYLETFI